MARLKRPNVKQTIRDLLAQYGRLTSADVQQATGLTRQAVHYHLRALLEAGAIEPVGQGRGAAYRLPAVRSTCLPIAGVEEDRVWADLVASDARLQNLSENALSIHRYTFTEVLNNAIEHSRGDTATVSLAESDDRLVFEIYDDGIGAFRSVREKFKLVDYFAALQAISKGKTTTDPEHHTGQGLFFSSKAVDLFVLEANGLRWTIDNLLGDQAVGDASGRSGTRVSWQLDNRTSRVLGSVFDEFTDEDLQFSRSRAAVRLFETGSTFVSRSEAKRLAEGLERFDEVEMDFRGVTEVGQGFVDEIFRVWAQGHPNVRLIPTGMSAAVEAMVRRGLPRRM